MCKNRTKLVFVKTLIKFVLGKGDKIQFKILGFKQNTYIKTLALYNLYNYFTLQYELITLFELILLAVKLYSGTVNS